MKKISLTQGQFTIVDDEDFEWLNQWKWYFHHTGYAVRTERSLNENKKSIHIIMHRIIMDASKDKEIDHINGDGLDNRRSNLRVCTHAQNQRNRKSSKNSSSKYKGVSWNKDEKKWVAGIGKDKKRIHLGFFNDQESAAIAYNTAALKYFGEFANINSL